MRSKKMLNLIDLEPLLEEALQTVTDPHYNPESENYNAPASVLRNVEIFRKNLGVSCKLDSFIDKAKWHINYETRKYGTILLTEQDYTDKLYIILKGNVHRLKQRAFNEIEQEAEKIERKGSLFVASELQLPQPPVLGKAGKRSATVAVNPFLQTRSSTKDTLKVETLRVDTPQIDLKNYLGVESPLLSPVMRKKSVVIKIQPSLNELDMEISKSPRGDNQVSNRNSPSIGSLNSIYGDIPQQNSRSRRGTMLKSMLLKVSASRRLSRISKDKSKEEKAREQEKEIEETTAFVKKIASKHPELEHRCLLKEVVRLQKVKTYNADEYI